MKNFEPNYHNIVSAAKNHFVARTPLYDHTISQDTIEIIMNKKIGTFWSQNASERKEFFDNFCEFHKKLEYDCVIIEMCIGSILPGGGALGGHIKGVIQNRADFERYPWDSLTDKYFDTFSPIFDSLSESLPNGMKAVGGVGNGVFEIAQELVGYEDLCLMSFDDPELYSDLFKKIGVLMQSIWKRFLVRYADDFCVLRFGDDLGYKITTMLPKNHVLEHIIPQYKQIVDLVHAYNKPFLLHSCGNLLEIFDELVDISGIDAKHSNEDVITPFNSWVEKFGRKVAFFGGIDTDDLCRKSPEEIADAVKNIMDYNKKMQTGLAVGCGNSIPSYVPVEGFLAMNEAVRKFREN